MANGVTPGPINPPSFFKWTPFWPISLIFTAFYKQIISKYSHIIHEMIFCFHIFFHFFIISDVISVQWGDCQQSEIHSIFFCEKLRKLQLQTWILKFLINHVHFNINRPYYCLLVNVQKQHINVWYTNKHWYKYLKIALKHKICHFSEIVHRYSCIVYGHSGFTPYAIAKLV